MSKRPVTRREFLRTAAALAVPTIVPVPLFGRDKTGEGMPSADSLRRIDAYWARYFGCSLKELKEGRTHVLPHQALGGYDGALVLRHGESCIISVPESVPEVERSKLRAAGPAEAFDPRFLAQTLIVKPDAVNGPTRIGIADRSSFKPVRSDARLLEAADEPALRKLAGECGELDCYRFRLIQVRKPIFGLFQGKDLVAISGYVVLEKVLAITSILVHPAHRGKGYAKAVASAAGADAIGKGYVALWRAPESDVGAVALGKAIGFHPYASTLGVELAEDTF